MTQHVATWLGAYRDGELRGLRLRQVETHLADCATCRTELARLRALAALMQESTAAGDLTPPERFVAQVGLRLPPRQAAPAWQRALKIGWQLAPLGLIGTWAFVQAVFIVAGVVLGALRMGLGGDLAASTLPALQGGPGLGGLFGLSDASLTDPAQIALRALGNGGPLGWGVTLYLVLLVLIGLLYWSWLASWWAYRQEFPPLLPDGHIREPGSANPRRAEGDNLTS